MAAPLQGVTVLEMANVISGPYAGMLLADLGADVIKIEMPGRGDIFRAWSGDSDGIRASFAAYNRGKRSVTIDVRTAEGAKAYLELARSADVIIENFRPGTLDRYGVGYEAVNSVNPRVLYCAVSGMGSTGPDSDRPTYDAIAQGMSGFWSQLTSMTDPEPVGPAMSDQLTGLYAALGIAGALAGGGRNGPGQRMDISMLGSTLAFNTASIASFLMDGELADKVSRARRSQSYAFVAGDGLPFAVHLSTPQKFWKGLAEVASRPELVDDPRFRTKRDRIANYDALHEVLQKAFGADTRDRWLTDLRDRDVPAGPINTIAEALDEPQVQHLQMVRRFGEGPRALDLVGFPFSFSSAELSQELPPPTVGEHTEEVLREAGFSDAQIAELRTASAI